MSDNKNQKGSSANCSVKNRTYVLVLWYNMKVKIKYEKGGFITLSKLDDIINEIKEQVTV